MSYEQISHQDDIVVYHFNVDGLKCQNCSGSIESKLLQKPQIVHVGCDHVNKILIVEVEKKYHPDFITQLIISEVSNLGFECALKQAEKPKKSLTGRWFAGALGVAVGLILMTLMMAGISFSLPVMAVIAATSTALTISLGFEFYRNAVQVYLRSRELNMNTLFAISTVTILMVSIASFFIPWLPMMFDAGLMIFGFRHIGIGIEASLKQSATSNLRLTDYIPKVVLVIQQKSKTFKPLKDVQVGQVIEIGPGEVVPLDGMVLNEGIMLYDTVVTGARTPRLAKSHETIAAGTFLASNSEPLQLQVSQPAEYSYLAKFDKQIQSAHQKPPIQTLAKSLLGYFIPGVLGLSLLSFFIVSSFFPISLAIQCAMTVLVSACPCTLGMIIPLSTTIGMSKASEKGVDFKSSKSMEEFGAVSTSIKKVVFDLHGTLTKGVPEVKNVWSMSEKFGVDDIIRLAALVENTSTHPVALAIKQYAKSSQSDLFSQSKVDHISLKQHHGVSAEVDGEIFVIGNRDMMLHSGIYLPPEPHCLKACDSRIYIAASRQLVGVIQLNDPLRQGAQQVVKTLKNQGIDVSICTGADYETASRYAKLLGVDSVRASCRGDEGESNPKARYIDELKSNQHKVLMVGDGPNDAAALAHADASIAVVSGRDIGHRVAQEQAMANIENKSLLPVLHAMSVSSETSAIIKQNLLFSLAYNAISLTLAGGGLLLAGFSINPAIGAALMILQSASVLSNAIRFKYQGDPSPTSTTDDESEQCYSYQSMMSNPKFYKNVQNEPVDAYYDEATAEGTLEQWFSHKKTDQYDVSVNQTSYSSLEHGVS